MNAALLSAAMNQLVSCTGKQLQRYLPSNRKSCSAEDGWYSQRSRSYLPNSWWSSFSYTKSWSYTDKEYWERWANGQGMLPK